MDIDSNPAERALHPDAIGRKTWLFVSSAADGDILADTMTLIESAKLAGLAPEAYLADPLARIDDHRVSCLNDLLLWHWWPAAGPQARAGRGGRDRPHLHPRPGDGDARRGRVLAA